MLPVYFSFYKYIINMIWDLRYVLILEVNRIMLTENTIQMLINVFRPVPSGNTETLESIRMITENDPCLKMINNSNNNDIHPIR